MLDNDNCKFRHELKYVITKGEQVLLKNRIENLLLPDSHSGRRV